MFSRLFRRAPEGAEAPMERRHSDQPVQRVTPLNRSSRRLSLGAKATEKPGQAKGPSRTRKEVLQQVDQERKERLQLNMAVFGEDWLNSCYAQVVYPNPACIELLERVSRALARRVSPPQDSEQKQQALFYLLGPEYTEQYFPRSTYSVHILEPPKMLPARKEKYLTEMTEFLRASLDKAMSDCGYPRLYTEHSVDDELYRYLLAARGVFRKGLEGRVRQEALKAGRRTGDSEAALLQLVEEGGPQTKVVGNSIVTLLAKQPTKKRDFVQSLGAKKYALPGALRRFVWTEVLAGKGKTQKVQEDQSWLTESLKTFTEDLAKEAKKQKLPRATRSKNGSAIDSAVIEKSTCLSTFDDCAVYKPLDSDDYAMRTARVLNTADVHSDNFSPCHVHLVVALRTAYQGQANLNQESENLQVALLLTQVTSRLLPRPDAVFAMAERALATLQDQDPFYYSHIRDSLATQTSKLSARGFPPEALDRNPAAAAKLHAELQKLPAAAALQGTQLQLLTDPALFVRKWIAQAFMGTLSISAGLWVWDQLMVGGWSPDIFICVSTAILSLIRPWMLRANKYSGAKKVLLQEPGKLYTNDLREVYTHLQNKGRLVESPPNTNYIGPPSPPAIQLMDEYGRHSPVQSDETRVRREKSTTRQRGRSSPSVAQDPAAEGGAKGREASKAVNNKGSPSKQNPAAAAARDDGRQGNKSSTPTRPRVSVKPLQVGANFSLEVGRLLEAADDDVDDDEPLPLPEPPPDSDSDDEQKKTRKAADNEAYEPPAPFVPPPTEETAWVPHNPAAVRGLPKPCRISDAVDLYIDAVRFLPDCGNFCKVTGRIHNIHLDDDVTAPDILAYPSLLGSQTCPTFRYRIALNEQRQFLNPDLVVLLTLYIHQESVRLVAPIGSCLLPLFNSELAEPLLRVGAYQVRLRHGRPKPEGGLSKLLPSDMDESLPIPALTLLCRILPHTKEYVAAPAYDTGAYLTEGCEPTPTERALIHHYCYHPEYETLTVQDKAEVLMAAEKEEGIGDLRKVEAYVRKKLQHRIPKGKTLAPVTDFAHFTEYDISKGVRVDVQGAFNLPEAYEKFYTLAYAEVIDSEEGEAEREKEEQEKKTIIEKKKAKGHEFHFSEEYPTGEQRMMTSRVDMKSSPRAPQWLDESVASLHPPMSPKTVLVVRLYGVQIEYVPGNGKKPGKISGLGGNPISINYKDPICWGVVQLFARGTVLGGTHFVPLFEGGPPPMVQAMLRRDRPASVLELAVRKSYVKMLPGASLEVRLWDGKVEEFTELPECTHRHLLAAVKAEDRAMAGREQTFHSSYEKFFLKKMKDDDQFVLSRVLIESEFFRQKANVEFGNALNKALEKAGKDPMPPLPVFVP